MSDIGKVIVHLKSTSKGKLKYGKDFSITGSVDDVPLLSISPKLIPISKNTSKLEDKNFVGEKESDFFQNYFSQRRREKDVIISPKNGTPVISHEEKVAKSRIKNYVSNSVATFVPPYIKAEMQLKDINEQYERELKDKLDKQVQFIHSKILEFDSEHAKSIESIEQQAMRKQSQEANKLYEEQNQMASDELVYYQEMKEQRASEALEKVQQAELHRKNIEMKIKREADLKRAKEEKKKTLVGFAEHGLELLNSLTKHFFNNGKNNKCEEFKLLVDQATREYTELNAAVKHGITENISDLDNKIKQGNQKIAILQDLLKASESLSKVIEEKARIDKKAAEDAEKKVKEDLEKKSKNEAEKVSVGHATEIQTTATETPAIPPLENNLSIAVAAPALAPIESMLKSMLQMFTTRSMFREYLRLQKLLTDTKNRHEPLSRSKLKEKKSYKFDLYKAVNTTINAISDESPKHLMDKILRLATLLSGKEVPISGKKVSTKLDPNALILSKDLIAQKLVLQGATQVSSSFKAAFPIAAVVLGIWCLFPDVGELLLANFFTRFPYTVPFYLPKSKELDTLDYCRLVGYTVDGEDVEAEDIYMKKLSGVIRLYAAVISSDMPAPIAKSHPYGLEHGWTWLTRVLNLEPRPVTATILFDFLEVAGHAMMKRFGKQFQKLLRILCEEYMPKILEVTPNESKAGAVRLKLFLETCIKNGRIKEPDGYLTKQWYSTTGHYR